MAEDIRLSINFWQHPKTLKLIRRGGRKGFEAVRSLQILWCFCAQERTDGILTGMDDEDIELAADWRGKPGALMELLVAGKWLDRLDDGLYALHGWEDRQAYVSKADSRKQQARAAAEARWQHKRGITGSMKSASPDSDESADDGREEQVLDTPDTGENADQCSPHMLIDADSNADSCGQHMLIDADSNAPIPIPIPDPDPDPIPDPDKNPSPSPSRRKGVTEKPTKRKSEPDGNTVPELRQAIHAFTDDEALRQALEDFRVMRERIRKPLTGRALELILRDLETLAPGDKAGQVEIVNQSVKNSWQGIFPLKGPVRLSFSGKMDGNSLTERNAAIAAEVLASRQQWRQAHEQQC